MEKSKEAAGLGIDLGSSAVRVSLFNFENDQLIAYKVKEVPYYFNPDSSYWKYTQSSQEILTAIDECLHSLHIRDYQIRSCGVAATCSLAIFKKKDSELKPWNFDDAYKNVVFWMDSTAIKETHEINQLTTLQTRAHMGGNFIPEMAIPKLKHFINLLKERNDTSTFEIIDLHRYVAMELAHIYHWDYENICNLPNLNKIGHDGELAGWSQQFYDRILPPSTNILIGPLKTRLNCPNNFPKVTSCIDCYASWFPLLSPALQNSLFVVGGTSTCYLYASSQVSHHIPGIWGPFSNILDASGDFCVYEGGQSCTGKLIEHLFKTHPASCHINYKEWPHLFKKIEEYIQKIEDDSKCSIHIQTRYMFFYGDLDGNRTPYADPEMSGMLIGETTDTSFRNLVYKYVCTLEFIAFQIKQMIEIFNDLDSQANINIIQFCGSLAKNQRILQLLSLLLPDIQIIRPKMDLALVGSYGSYLMGKACSIGKSIIEVSHSPTYPYENHQKIDQLVVNLLKTKYRIHLDMAKQQMRYRDEINIIMRSKNTPSS